MRSPLGAKAAVLGDFGVGMGAALGGQPRSHRRKLAPYLGQITTHTYPPATLNTAFKQFMDRTRHVCQTDVWQVQLMYVNRYAWNALAPGGNATITAAIEYPVGTFTRITFSGSAGGTIADGGYILSDTVGVFIPKGAVFYSRSYYTNPAGVIFNGFGHPTSATEGAVFAASGVADQTMGGSVASSTAAYAPVAIIGLTTAPSFGLIGDSRVHGVNDTISTATSATGELARSLGDIAAHINLGISSSTASQLVIEGATGLRAVAAQFCSHIVCQLGINDLSASRSAAAILADLQTIRSYFPDKPFFQCTIAPHTTSTDSWATTANQTPVVQEPARVTLNNLIRAVPRGFSGFIELADQVESARDSGLWKVGSTLDGLHESPAGYLAIQNSGVVNPVSMAARFLRGEAVA